jgi:ankyrin repeat protein
VDASKNAYMTIVQLLLENGADVNALGGYPLLAPLLAAMSHSHDNIALLLLSYGANVNTQGKDGSTTLAIASHHRWENLKTSRGC